MNRVRVLIIATALVGLAGCSGWSSTYDSSKRVLTYDSSNSSAMSHGTLTLDGTDAYLYDTSVQGAMDVVALSTNTGENLRTAFWPRDAPVETNEETCAVWTSQGGNIVQQGAALRVSADPVTGFTRAITVTKDVYLGANWIFNFHVWNDGEFTQIGATDLSALLRPNGVVAPLPWHFCARVVDSKVEFKVWIDTREPAWGDTTHGGAATVPQGWSTPGKAGWVIGHLPSRGTATFSNLTAWRYI